MEPAHPRPVPQGSWRAGASSNYAPGVSDEPEPPRVSRPPGLTRDHIQWVRAGRTRAALVDCFGRVFHLRRRTRVGRDADIVDLMILDEAVSSLHAELVLGEQGWIVLDRGSRNGTFVEGRRVLGEARLEEGDVVAFADVDFRFSGGEA